MPAEDKLKNLLKIAALAARKHPTDRQLDEAVTELVKKAHVTKSDLRVIGEKVAFDQEIFAVADPDDVNDILSRKKNG